MNVTLHAFRCSASCRTSWRGTRTWTRWTWNFRSASTTSSPSFELRFNSSPLLVLSLLFTWFHEIRLYTAASTAMYHSLQYVIFVKELRHPSQSNLSCTYQITVTRAQFDETIFLPSMDGAECCQIFQNLECNKFLLRSFIIELQYNSGNRLFVLVPKLPFDQKSAKMMRKESCLDLNTCIHIVLSASSYAVVVF